MTSQQKWIWGIVAAVVVGIIWWGSQRQTSDDTIEIGVIGTLSKLGQYQGQQQNRGLEIARDEINEKGGINDKRIEFVVEDSQADPATAVSAFRKLVSGDGVKFIIGDSWNSTTVPLLPIADESGVLLISPVAGLDQLSADDMFFRTMPSVTTMMEELAKYAYTNLGSRRVGIIQQQNPFGEEHAVAFTKRFEELGGEIVVMEEIALTATDVRTELTKIAAVNPDTILNLHTSGPPIGLVMRQAQELGIEARWLSHFGAENIPLLEQYGDVVEGLIYPYSYDAKSAELSVRKFVTVYQARYGELPDLTATNAYDALQVLALAIEEAGDSPSSVAERLLTIRDYEGVSGTFSFDENGDVQKPILVKAIQNGQFVRSDSAK